MFMTDDHGSLCSMGRRRLVTVVGEALVDVVRCAGGDERVHPGGSPANVAVGLARLGVPVELITRFGRDSFGDLVDRHLRANGVRLRHPRDSWPTSVAEAVVDSAGVATYDFRLRWDLDLVAPCTAPEAILVHTGSIAALLEPGSSSVRRIVEDSREFATISYDPNCRPSIVGDVAAARRGVDAHVELSDVVKASDEDIEWLYPGRHPQDVAEAWLARGPAVVIVTRGARGPWGITRSGPVERPAPQVRVADTVGAGDSFVAAVIAGLVHRGLVGAGRRPALRELGSAAFSDLLGEAAAAAALTCSRTGADPPTEGELFTFSRQPS
jgi:fructokinase